MMPTMSARRWLVHAWEDRHGELRLDGTSCPLHDLARLRRGGYTHGWMLTPAGRAERERIRAQSQRLWRMSKDT